MCSGYRAPCTVIFEAALSMSRRSSGVSSMAAAPMFSSRRASFVVPGIGTIHVSFDVHFRIPSLGGRLATGHLLDVFGISSPLHRDLRGGAVDVTEIVRGKFDGSCSDVLLQARQFRGAWDWNNPRLPGKQPCERDLGRCRLLPFSDLAQQINQGLIRLSSLRRKAWEGVAKVGTVELRVFGDLSREEALPQRAIWNKADAELLERRQHFRFRPPRPQRVFALDGCDRLDCVCATNRSSRGFRKAEVLHLTFLNEVLHRSRHVFDWHVRVDAVLIEQIDGVGLESLERGLGDPLDVVWPAVQAHPTRRPVGTKFEPELRGGHHLSTERSEGFAHEFFVCERAVHFGGIEECDAAVHGCPEKRGHLLLVFGRTVRKAHSHAAEPESRNFQAALSKFALLHCFSFETVSLISRLESSALEAVS